MQLTIIIRCSLPVLLMLAYAAGADTVAENNMAANPPLFQGGATGCKAEFKTKSAGFKDHHGFVVITGPDGKLLELRGGPSAGGSEGSSMPGFVSTGSGEQPSGNPFGCEMSHKWGVVVPYVGPHGNLGVDEAGSSVYSPDGITDEINFSVDIGPGAQKNVCAMANCMMTVIKAFGASCKNYTAGTGLLRNSNTLISAALSSCGVPDPLPASMSAPGWGNSWN